MYARKAADRELTFDFGAGLIKDNLLLVDRETRSVWSQLDAKAVSGPLQGTPLEIIPSIQTTWGFWRQKYPDTRVMVLEDEGRPYFYRNRKPGQPRPKEPPKEHDTSNLGLGLVMDDQAYFYPLRELAEAGRPVHQSHNGETVTIHSEPEALTAWGEDAQGNLLPGVLVYQDGWMNFFPESIVYSADEG